MSNFLSDLFNALGNMGGSWVELKLSRWVNMDANEAKREIDELVMNGSKSQIQDLEQAFKDAIAIEFRPFRQEQLADYYTHFRNATNRR